MKFQIDHDLHIHSIISPCAGHDPRQTKEAILSYGITAGLKLINVADHLWDEKVPCAGYNLWLDSGCSLEKGKTLLPLPQSPHCKFLFGIEADMDLSGNLAASREEMDNMDFVVISPSHLHLAGFAVPPDLPADAETHKKWYLERMHHLLSMDDLPWPKTGLAHPTCSLACTQDPLRMFDIITDDEYEEMWTRLRDRGMGIEINPDGLLTPETMASILRPYQIAKAVGCRFYLGSDCHTPDAIPRAKPRWEQFIDLLHLTEDDKMPFVHEMISQ